MKSIILTIIPIFLIIFCLGFKLYLLGVLVEGILTYFRITTTKDEETRELVEEFGEESIVLAASIASWYLVIIDILGLISNRGKW